MEADESFSSDGCLSLPRLERQRPCCLQDTHVCLLCMVLRSVSVSFCRVLLQQQTAPGTSGAQNHRVLILDSGSCPSAFVILGREAEGVIPVMFPAKGGCDGLLDPRLDWIERHLGDWQGSLLGVSVRGSQGRLDRPINGLIH